jgi:hypothetical protein
VTLQPAAVAAVSNLRPKLFYVAKGSDTEEFFYDCRSNAAEGTSNESVVAFDC